MFRIISNDFNFVYKILLDVGGTEERFLFFGLLKRDHDELYHLSDHSKSMYNQTVDKDPFKSRCFINRDT